MSKNTRNRILLTAVAALLLVCVTVGGTLAWLVDSTDEVANTFTATDIAIKLEETWNADSDDEDTVEDHWEMPLIPGTTKSKNPVVTVVRDETNVDIYLFVKYTETITGGTAGKDYLTYTNNLESNGWTALTGEDGVYYRVVTADEVSVAVDSEATNNSCANATCSMGEGTLHWHLIGGDSVTVNDALTADDTDSASITITYEAWAIQKDGFTSVSAAWNAVKDATPATDGSTAGTTVPTT